MIKRVTITLDEEMYIKVLEYSLERSKAEIRNVSTSEAIRELLAMQMRRMGKVKGGRSSDFVPKVGSLDSSEV